MTNFPRGGSTTGIGKLKRMKKTGDPGQSRMSQSETFAVMIRSRLVIRRVNDQHKKNHSLGGKEEVQELKRRLESLL